MKEIASISRIGGKHPRIKIICKGKTVEIVDSNYELSTYPDHDYTPGNNCSMFAVANALNISFEEAYDLLAAEGKGKKVLMNHIYNIENVLKANGFIKLPRKYWRDTPSSFDYVLKNIEYIDDPVVIQIKNHIFTVKDHLVYDFWYPDEIDRKEIDLDRRAYMKAGRFMGSKDNKILNIYLRSASYLEGY